MSKKPERKLYHSDGIEMSRMVEIVHMAKFFTAVHAKQDTVHEIVRNMTAICTDPTSTVEEVDNAAYTLAEVYLAARSGDLEDREDQ